MGLNKDEGRKIYLNISDGKIVRQHANPIEGVTVTRENKNGKNVHEEFFRSVTGALTNIRSKETPFGMVWEITLQDNGEEFVLSFNYSSRYTNHFFRALPNVDLMEPVTINPWSMKDKNDPSKTVAGLTLYQNKEKIPFAYDKENPGDMPELKQKKVKGKTVWDDSDQLEFFENMVKEKILPALNVKVIAPAPSNDELEDAPF
jgi:hypothetical protein